MASNRRCDHCVRLIPDVAGQLSTMSLLGEGGEGDIFAFEDLGGAAIVLDVGSRSAARSAGEHLG